MKRYHALTLERPNYVPMDPKEKAEKIKRLEARLAGKITLDDKGDVSGYGMIDLAPKPVDDNCSAIDDAKLDLGRSKKVRTVMVSTPAPIMDEPTVHDESQSVTNGLQPETVWIDESLPKPVMSMQEFEERVEKLYQQSEAFHKEFMAKFGPKE